MNNDLTDLQKQYFMNRAKGMKKGKAALAAGYSKAVADRPKQQIEAHIEKDTFTKMMQKVGITDHKLATVLNEGLSANKVITSPTEPDYEYADHQARHRFLDTALRLSSKYPKDELTINQDVTFHVQLTDPSKPVVELKQDKPVDNSDSD